MGWVLSVPNSLESHRADCNQRGEEYPDVVNYVRTKVRVALLKSVLIAIRGERGKSRSRESVPISDLSLNLVPERQTYEV